MYSVLIVTRTVQPLLVAGPRLPLRFVFASSSHRFALRAAWHGALQSRVLSEEVLIFDYPNSSIDNSLVVTVADHQVCLSVNLCWALDLR